MRGRPKKKRTIEARVASLEAANRKRSGTLRELQRRLTRMERRDRVIRGFSPSLDVLGEVIDAGAEPGEED